MPHPNITLTPCQSSNLLAHGYDTETQTLALQFKTGVYHYPEVPAAIYDGLKEAESVGSYVAKAIRPNFKGELRKPAIGPTDI